MENKNFLEQIKSYLEQEDLIGSGREISALKTSFEDYMIEVERLDQIKRMEATDKGETVESPDFKSEKEAFFTVYKDVQEKRKAQVELKNALEAGNLKQKKELILRFKDLIENEENIGNAFATRKEIHETWKKIGDIPREKRDEIQKEYSRYVEIFHHTINIYKVLKENDYKKNSQLKDEVIFKLKNLRNSSKNVRDIEATLRTLQDEWEGIGPVQNEQWEELKASYWEAVKSVYEKINNFYDEQRHVLLENLQKKRELVAELIEATSNFEAASKQKDWDVITEKVLAIQERWKHIGFGPKKENEAIWVEFRGICDKFFEAKKEFNKSIDAVLKANADLKRALIEEVKKIESSKEWKTAADKIVSLQKKWKQIGNAGHRFENKLWAEFRASCDTFYNARDAYFAAQDESLTKNLQEKIELIAEIEAFDSSIDKQLTLAKLKEFSERFNAIGHVPMKQKNEVYDRYKKAVDAKYAAMKLEASEKEAILFQAKMETLQASPERSKLLINEKNEIRKQIDLLKKEIMQLENNLGFFAKSKGADQLRKDVETKVASANNKIESLKRKLKLIPNE
ncbi:MAG: DUF349 domain-containing protein [Crocinitomicaceae bacterium]|nr:DUF349 domain-containing protein [Crocinitomicaceae bacterium]